MLNLHIIETSPRLEGSQRGAHEKASVSSVTSPDVCVRRGYGCPKMDVHFGSTGSIGPIRTAKYIFNRTTANGTRSIRNLVLLRFNQQAVWILQRQKSARSSAGLPGKRSGSTGNSRSVHIQHDSSESRVPVRAPDQQHFGANSGHQPGKPVISRAGSGGHDARQQNCFDRILPGCAVKGGDHEQKNQNIFQQTGSG